MTENKRYKLWRELDLDGHTEDWAIEVEGFDEVICEEEVADLLNKQEERIQILKDELSITARDYQLHHEVISFADDLIMSHLTKHYQRQWKNFCKKRGVNE